MPKNHKLENIISDPRTLSLKDIFKDEGSLYLVGGCIRNALLDLEVADLDFATSLTPEDCQRALEAKGIRTIATGIKHLTITAIPCENLPQVEITSFRVPVDLGKNDLEVSSDIYRDLQYRDFTINSIALCPWTGKLLDPHNGIKDLDEKTLKTTGKASERFGEDPLRIMRMVRFATSLGFTIDKNTLDAAKASAMLLSSISSERIRDEFSKILVCKHPKLGLQMMEEIKALEILFPEIQRFVNFEQNEFHTKDLFHHSLLVVEKVPYDITLRLAALLHDVGKPDTLSIDEEGRRHFYKHEAVGADQAEDFLLKWRFPKKLAKDVKVLVRTHMRPLNCQDGGIRRILRDTDELYEKWRILKEADAKSCKIDSDTIQSQLDDFDHRVRLIKEDTGKDFIKLAINGRDLMEAGVPEGPQIGEILRMLSEKVMDEPELNTKESLMSLIGK